MRNICEKTKLIFLPFLLIAHCFIAGYTFLNWALVIKGPLPYDEEIINGILPVTLPWIPLLIWLRTRIRLLHFKEDKSYFFILITAAFAISIPTIIAQHYLVTATGKLTVVDNVTQIGQREKTRYYQLKHYYIDKEHAAMRPVRVVSGKRNESVTMHIYVALPVYADTSDQGTAPCNYWIGKIYTKQISNSLPPGAQEERYQWFAAETQDALDQEDFGGFTYMEVLSNIEDDELNTTIRQSPLANNTKPLIFRTRFQPFGQRNGNNLKWLLGSFGISAVLWFFFLMIAPMNQLHLSKHQLNEQKKKNSFPASI